MIIKKYGIELVRLREEDIELVRQKRNSQEIRSKMFYQKTISPEEQKAWFKSINNENNFYFVIKTKGQKVGLIHGIVHSYTSKIAEGGLLIWDTASLNSHIPISASICMADLTFLIIKMNKTIAEVRIDNPLAINYNLKLGYTKEKEIGEKIIMELTSENYFLKSKKIKELIQKITKENSPLSWDDIQFNLKDFEVLYPLLPPYLQLEMVKKRPVVIK